MRKVPSPADQLPVADWAIDVTDNLFAAVFSYRVLDPHTGALGTVPPLFMTRDQVVELHKNLGELVQYLKPFAPGSKPS